MGTCLLSTLVSSTVLILDFSTSLKNDFKYIYLNFAALRTALFLVLTGFSAVLENRPIDVADLESSPLLPNQTDHLEHGRTGPQCVTRTDSIKVIRYDAITQVG
jgi:hypothetical protein